MEHQRCYVFNTSSERPVKRRRVDQSGLQASWRLREEAFKDLWARQEQRIQNVLTESNATTLSGINSFITQRSGDISLSGKIPTGLVIAGPSIAAHGPFFDQLSKHVTSSSKSRFVLLPSGECPNFKTLLKVLIRKATARNEEDDADDHVRSSRKGPKLLNFDLQLLHDWLSEHETDHVVIAFQDSEAFDGPLLGEAIELFITWLNRIPFTLLFGIATSADNFHAKLPRSALRSLSGEHFDVAQSQEVLEKFFWTSVTDIPLRPGAGLSADLLERQKDHIQSVQAFTASLKYAYMSHFYANPLSVLLYPNLQLKELNTEDFEAVRNLPSFQYTAQDLLDQNETSTVRRLLDSNKDLFDYVQSQLQKTQTTLQNLISACELLSTLRDCFPSLPTVSLSTLYIRAMSNQLAGSSTVREFLLAFKKAPSDNFLQIINLLVETWGGEASAPKKILTIRAEVEELLFNQDNSKATLRSQHDMRNETLRTTVVAQKVELRAQKASLSKQDQKYSELLLSFHDQLATYFESALLDPASLFGYEVCVYDIKSPQRAVFMPRTRFVVERGLSIPHDYLNCECCPVGAGSKEEEGTLSGSQPATAILYQLYLESGALINASDLWSAFFAIVGEEGGEEAPVMAQFQQALAELKYLGFIKASRKKTDHVAKVLWKGL